MVNTPEPKQGPVAVYVKAKSGARQEYRKCGGIFEYREWFGGAAIEHFCRAALISSGTGASFGLSLVI